MNTKFSLSTRRYKLVVWAAVTGLLLVMAFATVTQTVDWEQQWSAAVIFALLVALSDLLDLAPPRGRMA